MFLFLSWDCGLSYACCLENVRCSLESFKMLFSQKAFLSHDLFGVFEPGCSDIFQMLNELLLSFLFNYSKVNKCERIVKHNLGGQHTWLG